MRTARRYIAREIYRSTLVVLVALVGLFMFFALIEGLDKVGKRLTLLDLFYLQLLDLPNHLYELLPIGLLIGTVLALAGLAQRNELTILRASGVSGLRLLGALWLIAVPLMLAALILSEYITPAAELQGSESRLMLLGRTDGGRMASGYWFKENDDQGHPRIINIRRLEGRGQVSGIELYEFGDHNTMRARIRARQGQFTGDRLRLQDLDVLQILPRSASALDEATAPASPLTTRSLQAEREIRTTLTPERLIARVLTPERMAISDLLDYIDYLEKNQLQSDRQEIALWRKLAYPFTLLVMVTIATPIAFIQSRRGGVGPKVFAGILIGVLFFMINQLALNAGMLGNWPPWATALVPDLFALAAALAILLGMENRHSLALWWRNHRLRPQLRPTP
ncbi:LPS export ABC transporter permease LptG [Castellaniella sp.]|uniref:LPS export ABC transporter permease LptG n=1 Tax=Castellaniella sp. TaxID=1955812 RepID=UPI00355F9228